MLLEFLDKGHAAFLRAGAIIVSELAAVQKKLQEAWLFFIVDNFTFYNFTPPGAIAVARKSRIDVPFV